MMRCSPKRCAEIDSTFGPRAVLRVAAHTGSFTPRVEARGGSVKAARRCITLWSAITHTHTHCFAAAHSRAARLII